MYEVLRLCHTTHCDCNESSEIHYCNFIIIKGDIWKKTLVYEMYKSAKC